MISFCFGRSQIWSPDFRVKQPRQWGQVLERAEHLQKRAVAMNEEIVEPNWKGVNGEVRFLLPLDY